MWKGKIKLRVCLLNWMVLLNADFLVYTWGLPLTWPEASYCSSFLEVSATASLWAGSQFFSFLSLINLSCNFFGNNSKMGFTPTWYKPLGLFQVSGIYKKKTIKVIIHINILHEWSWNNCQKIIFYKYCTQDFQFPLLYTCLQCLNLYIPSTSIDVINILKSIYLEFTTCNTSYFSIFHFFNFGSVNITRPSCVNYVNYFGTSIWSFL